MLDHALDNSDNEDIMFGEGDSLPSYSDSEDAPEGDSGSDNGAVSEGDYGSDTGDRLL